MRLFWIVAVLSFVATFPLSRTANRARCIEAVRAVPMEGGSIGAVLEKRHASESLRWTYDAGIVRFSTLYTWSCSGDSVPLVLPVDDAAKKLTPNRVLE